MGKIIRISVRDLVEFIMRAGDLDERYAGAPEEAMLEGARMHRKLQREAGPDYTAEVPLSIYYPIVLPSSDLASAEDKAVSDSDDTAPASIPRAPSSERPGPLMRSKQHTGKSVR